MSGKYISKNGNSTDFFYKKYRISAGSLLLEKRNYQAGWLIGFNSRTYDRGYLLIAYPGFKELYDLDFYYFSALWLNLKFYKFNKINLALRYECLLTKIALVGKYGNYNYKGGYLFNNIGFTISYKLIKN
jgi:hypothetical protein